MSDSEKLPQVLAENEYLYDTVNWLKCARDHEERCAARRKLMRTLREQSDLCRQKAKIHKGVDLAVPYGENNNQPEEEGHGTEAFDWFAPFRIPDQVQNVLVYIHGGYWKALDLPESSHWATAVTDFGGIFVGLSYRLAPWQPLQTMPQRIAKGLQAVFEYSKRRIAEKIKTEPNIHMHVFGHSAGAHLAIESIAYALQSSEGERPAWIDSVRSVILLSGVFDLRPIIHTSINQALKLEDTEQAWDVSPLRLFSEPDRTVSFPASIRWLIAWAQYDSPALIDQSRQLTDLMRNCFDRIGERNTCSLETFCVPNEDHFTSIERLQEGAKHYSFMERLVECVKADCPTGLE